MKDLGLDGSSLGTLVQGAANESNGSGNSEAALESAGVEGTADSHDEGDEALSEQVAD